MEYYIEIRMNKLLLHAMLNLTDVMLSLHDTKKRGYIVSFHKQARPSYSIRNTDNDYPQGEGKDVMKKG